MGIQYKVNKMCNEDLEARFRELGNGLRSTLHDAAQQSVAQAMKQPILTMRDAPGFDCEKPGLSDASKVFRCELIHLAEPPMDREAKIFGLERQTSADLVASNLAQPKTSEVQR